jgi:hypothetical protein
MRELGSNAPGLSTHLVCLHCVTTNYAVLPDLRIELEQVICCYHMLYRRAAITSIWCVRCPCWRRPHCCTGLAWRHIPKYAWGCAPQPQPRLFCGVVPGRRLAPTARGVRHRPYTLRRAASAMRNGNLHRSSTDTSLY